MPRSRARALFEFRGQWIAPEPGSPFLHRFWTVAGTGRTRRRSLGTADIDEAKVRFVEQVLVEGPKTPGSYLSAVLDQYFTERTDKLPSATQSRNGGKVVQRCWGKKIRVAELTEAKQKEYIDWSLERGHALSYVVKNLGIVKAACAHCNVHPPAKIITSEEKLIDKWALEVKPPRRVFIPTDDELVRILQANKPERFTRWIILMLLTNARPEAAIELNPTSRRRDAGIVDLNPEGRRQNKKYRPTVREPRCLRACLDRWERDGLDDFGGTYCGYSTVNGPDSAVERLREIVGMPKLSLYSFRHKVTTVLRKHRVHEDQVSMQMGHRRKDLRTTAAYGEYDPDYLRDAARALDAWFLQLRRRVNSRATPDSGRIRTMRAA